MVPTCLCRLGTYPQHALTPSMALGVAAFKAFLEAFLQGHLHYGPMVGWAWVHGNKFRMAKERGFDDFMVPDFAHGEFDKVCEESVWQGRSMQQHSRCQHRKHDMVLWTS